MMIREQIQSAIHKLEVGVGASFLKYVTLAVAVLSLGVLYDLCAYHSFNSPEAMDAAQVARNLSEGRGFTTDFIRPFSIYLLQQHNRAAQSSGQQPTNAADAAQLDGSHPDLANAPVYPLVLAGLFKARTPQWSVNLTKPFWSQGGNFRRYQPEFFIAIFNQFLLLAVVVLTFLVARKLFDATAAWLSALLMIGSDLLWKFSVSGLPTMLLLVIFLGLIWCIVKTEELGRREPPDTGRLFFFAIAAGLLTALGMLTRYSFGWLILPVTLFLAIFGGPRRTGVAVVAFLVFAVAAAPWIARNLAVSGTPFGTAGYAMLEGSTAFPDSQLMQSLNPDLADAFHYWVRLCLKKLLENSQYLLQSDLLHLGGAWVGVLFFAGLLLGLRSLAARRLRYFTMMCLGVFIVVQAVGRTQLSDASPEMNSENLLALLTPLVVIFGVAFFLTLLNQMNVPSLGARFGVMGLLAALACQPLVTTLALKVPVVSYPPYYPPDIQKISGWMRPDELTMSDVPWAVAWYGDRQCTWTTLNAQYEFFSLSDYIKPVNALYLTMQTLNDRLLTDCVQGGADSWGNFVLKTAAVNQLPPRFPLRNTPLETLISGLYLTDRQRWNTP
jgi:hypothetical protein